MLGKLKSLFRIVTKTKKRIVLTLIILLVVGFFARRTFFPSTNGLKKAVVERGTVRQELILSGEVAATEHAKLTFQSSGELDWLGVSEGDEVKKGQLLAKLDTQVLNHAFEQAKSNLRYYQAVVDRVHDDVKGNDEDETFTQKETRTQAEVNKDNAYEAYLTAQKNLANASLRAPFNGVVTSIAHPYSNVNTFLTESQIEIVNPVTIYFDVAADQNEVNEISVGQKVAVVLDSFSDKELEGEVQYISLTPKVGEVGANYKVKVLFSSDIANAYKIRIGMTGDAKFVLSQKESVLYIPPQFVKSDLAGKYLKLGTSNNKTFIETGLEGDDRIEIKSDAVKVGDTVYD
jgi:RND family efflux transporter MFP subunit